MESKVPRANAGLSVQEYVDKTIGDALEMFGSGEASLKRLQTSIGAALPQAFQLDVPMDPEEPLSRTIFVRGFKGLLPDYMHMVHLACAVDFLGSMLLEVTDDATVLPGASREKRLDVLWKDYRHLMAVATAFRDMEMLMLNNGHSGGTSVNYMLPAARSSELHASQVAFLARLPPISLKNAT
ncbi:unnamed protein product [Symbiodinium microadriaticum]|nr:unnamed protein product [Symbiodinium microadriaticum]